MLERKAKRRQTTPHQSPKCEDCYCTVLYLVLYTLHFTTHRNRSGLQNGKEAVLRRIASEGPCPEA